MSLSGSCPSKYKSCATTKLALASFTSSQSIIILSLSNLEKELGRLDAPGRPILFGTTEEFLRTFGVQGLEELPAVDPVKMADFKAEAEEEVQLKLDI